MVEARLVAGRWLLLLAALGCLGAAGPVRLTPSDGQAGDEFGHSVALAGDTAIVGAPLHAANGNLDQGAVYVYVKVGGVWQEQEKLVAPDGVSGDRFGYRVEFDGSTLLVLSPRSPNGFTDASVYAFNRNGSSWDSPQVLPYAMSFAVDGNTLLLGRSGGAEVYTKQANSWVLQQELSVDNSYVNFGWSSALSGDTAVLGDLGNAQRGYAFVFVRSGETWTLQEQLGVAEAGSWEYFATSLALSGDQLLVGANGLSDSGGAFFFQRNANAWSQTTPVLPRDSYSNLGFDLAMSGDLAAIAGTEVSSNILFGMVEVWARSADTWFERDLLDASNECSLGGVVHTTTPLAISNDTLLLGAYGDPDITSIQEQACVFYLVGDVCDADADCDTGHCEDGVCCESECAGECAACSVSEGASADGTCTLFARGADGSPSCGELTCTGDAPACATCQTDLECAADEYCSSENTCLERRPLGEGCDAAALGDCRVADCRVCKSGFCAEGVCCDRDCSSPAESCLAADKQDGEDGTCGVRASATSGNACSDDSSCASGVCHQGVCCNRRCTEAESCLASDKVSGDDGSCGETKTATLGSACSSNTTCSSGVCFDLVCCEALCSPSQACSAEYKVEGANGTCGAAKHALPGATCEDGSTCSSGFCSWDGVCCDRDCQAPEACRSENKTSGADTGVCGASAAGVLGHACTRDQNCDSGHCVDGVCCDSACKGGCQSCRAELNGGGSDGQCGFVRAGIDPDAECGDNAACDVAPTCNGAGRCACDAGSAMCDAEGLRRVPRDTTLAPQNCAPYRCESGVCLARCDSAAECAPGARCSADNACVAPEMTAAADGGCACWIGAQHTRVPPLLLVGVLGGIYFSRRRRRSQRQVALRRVSPFTVDSSPGLAGLRTP